MSMCKSGGVNDNKGENYILKKYIMDVTVAKSNNYKYKLRELESLQPCSFPLRICFMTQSFNT